MIYRSYGKTNKKVSLIGMGTARLDADHAKFSINVELVLKALALGINYFDTAPTYASGASDKILGAAFQEVTNRDFYVSSKSMLSMDDTADAVLRRIENTLSTLHIEKITFFHMWSVLDLGQYQKIIAPGGPYEGALRAKQEGLIDHICFSTHCDGAEVAKIIDDGFLEGVTLGYNAMNYRHRQDGLVKAAASGLGVAIMNPLAGGLIPGNPSYFKYLQIDNNSIVESAIQFVAAHQEVSTILIGVNNERDLNEAVMAVDTMPDISVKRWQEIADDIPEPIEALCTMCDYCRGCPAGLQVSRVMGSYNEYVLSGCNEVHFHEWRNRVYGMYPFQTIACLKCGRCENKCTQHLSIMSRIEKINEICGKEVEKLRKLCELYFPRKGYPKTGIYGLSVEAETMLKAYQYFHEHMPEEIAFFDSNKAKWGTKVIDTEYIILPPDSIKRHNVKRIIITAKKYAGEIKIFLQDYIEEGTEICEL